MSRQHRIAPLLAAGLLIAVACSGPPGGEAARTTTSVPDQIAAEPTPPPAPANSANPSIDIYANDRPGMLSPAVKGVPTRVYVPNSDDSTVDVIDPANGRIISHFAVGKHPQHIVPSWDLKTLYVASDEGDSLTPIDPVTGQPGGRMAVDDPYNLYFTPDGLSAMVVAERLARLDFRDPHTFALQRSLHVPCKGVDHVDFSADGTYLIASCEFAGTMIKVRMDGPEGPRVDGPPLLLAQNARPQDVKLSPDASVFYVADMNAGGVWELDGATFSILGFLKTGGGAHGLYVSRDSKTLYVSNRAVGSVSLVDLSSRTIRATWHIPGKASPDMGGVSADGKVLWLSGRSDHEVYAIDTTTGALVARIPVGKSPHGISIFPQPGRYSLGHTGIFR